jgi:DNA-binding ferritin-like protein
MTKTRKTNKTNNIKKSHKRSSFSKKIKLIKMLLSIQHKVKIVHWSARDYNVHNATDKLYTLIQSNVDEIVEKSNLTTREINSLLSLSKVSRENIESYLKNCVIKLRKIRVNREIDAIVDVIIGDLQQALYLIKMK